MPTISRSHAHPRPRRDARAAGNAPDRLEVPAGPLPSPREDRHSEGPRSRLSSRSAGYGPAASPEPAGQLDRLAEIGQQVTAVAHEGRNALNHIVMALYNLERRHPPGDENASDLASIRYSCNDLLRLFEDLRGHAVGLDLDLQVGNLGAVLAAAWAELDIPRAGRAAELRVLDESADLACVLDPARMQQVFRNLLANALEACPDPVVIEARCDAARLGGRRCLRVLLRDNGPGMPAPIRRRAFEPFFTTKAHGTGLGLAIARRIVEAHGGRLTAGSGAPGGAEFVVLVPRRSGPRRRATLAARPDPDR